MTRGTSRFGQIGEIPIAPLHPYGRNPGVSQATPHVRVVAWGRRMGDEVSRFGEESNYRGFICACPPLSNEISIESAITRAPTRGSTTPEAVAARLMAPRANRRLRGGCTPRRVAHRSGAKSQAVIPKSRTNRRAPTVPPAATSLWKAQASISVNAACADPIWVF